MAKKLRREVVREVKFREATEVTTDTGIYVETEIIYHNQTLPIRPELPERGIPTVNILSENYWFSRMEEAEKIASQSEDELIRQDGKDLGWAIRSVRDDIKSSNRFDFGRLLHYASEAGRLHDAIMFVRHAEKFARAGKNSAVGSKKIGIIRSAKQAKNRPDFQALVAAEIERQREAGEPIDYDAACLSIVVESGASMSTVKRHAKNIWTKGKRGRKPRKKTR